jgi:hypothetical protein
LDYSEEGARFGRFDLEAEFQRFDREQVEARFNGLKDNLLEDALIETETLALHPRLKHAANEAAGLAWTTEFPLLVFPELFDEFAKRERVRHTRQQKIRARTQSIMPV